MILKIITIVFIFTNLTRFSIANDSLKQESIEMYKDCPRQKYCKKGSHVVCMYYDPDKVFGHHCKEPVRVEVTPNMVHHILANVNFLRGKVAMGKETGKDDEVLPRAYGLMKLEWDRDLAFSAQVLANQCLGDREDECRASERFPNPGQTIAIIQYKYPNWEYLQSSDSQRGLDEMKLIFAMDIFLRSSHMSKRNMTKDIFTNYPPLDRLVDINQKHYLNLVYGGVTHIGCGVSAYPNKIKGDKEAIKNIVQIVCNFSDAPKRNQPVYNIVPPIPGQGYTEQCGCPRGYKETSSCLCEREAKSLRRRLQLKNELETDLKQDTRKSIKHRNEGNVSSEKKDKQINDQLPRHVISKSRNFIVFRRNREGYLPEDRTVVNIESTTFTGIRNATMVSRFTPKGIEGVERTLGHGSYGSGHGGGHGRKYRSLRHGSSEYGYRPEHDGHEFDVNDNFGFGTITIKPPRKSIITNVLFPKLKAFFSKFCG